VISVKKEKKKMLKGIPKVLTPEMLKILDEMGHDDEIVIVDAHFPAESMGKRVIQYPCIDAPEMVKAILQVFPLDSYVSEPIKVMQIVPSDLEKGMKRPAMWDEVLSFANDMESFEVKLGDYERFEFYEHTKTAYAVIQTGEERQYGNFMLRKGVVLGGK
jgi:L-fucose mutarotase